MTWTDEFDEKFVGHAAMGEDENGKMMYDDHLIGEVDDIKSFISELLDKQRKEIVEELEKIRDFEGKDPYQHKTKKYQERAIGFNLGLMTTRDTLDQAITKIKGE